MGFYNGPQKLTFFLLPEYNTSSTVILSVLDVCTLYDTSGNLDCTRWKLAHLT